MEIVCHGDKMKEAVLILVVSVDVMVRINEGQVSDCSFQVVLLNF